jgi:hypothetical protein
MRLRSASRARLIAREIRQPRGREGVRQRSGLASASVDVLRVPASLAQLAMISPSPDTGPTWPNGRFFLLSASISTIGTSKIIDNLC